jgi:hypothetical protein
MILIRMSISFRFQKILHSKQDSAAVFCVVFCFVVNIGTLYLDVLGLNLILHIVLLWCATLFLASREVRRLIVFDSRVLMKISGPKRDEVTRGWKKVHNRKF